MACETELADYVDDAHITNSDSPTSTAIVLVDEFDRTGIVQWGACADQQMWAPIHADWHHIMYLDKLTFTDRKILQDYHGVVSADLCCTEFAQVADQLSYLDYLFTSEEFPGQTAALNLPVRGQVIAHTPGSVMISGKHGIIKRYEFVPTPGLNALGAGDYFAAHCVAGLLEGKLDLLAACAGTLEMLRRQT